MSVTKVRLEYQKETGLGLSTIDSIAENPHWDICETCKYITWLENKVNDPNKK